MTKPYSLDLRDRAVARVAGGGDGSLGCGDVAGGRFERREPEVLVTEMVARRAARRREKWGAIGGAF